MKLTLSLLVGTLTYCDHGSYTLPEPNYTYYGGDFHLVWNQSGELRVVCTIQEIADRDVATLRVWAATKREPERYLTTRCRNLKLSRFANHETIIDEQ